MLRRSFKARKGDGASSNRGLLLWSIGGAVVVVFIIFIALAQFSQAPGNSRPTWKNLVHTVVNPAQAFRVAKARIQHKAIPATPPPASPTPAPTPAATATPSTTTPVAVTKKTIEHKVAHKVKALAPATTPLTTAGSTVASTTDNGAAGPIVPLTPAPVRHVTTTPPPAATAAPETFADPQLQSQASADYPSMARDQNVQGTVIVLVSVSVSGSVSSASVAQSSGNKLLDSAAVRAAYRSKFAPATRNGTPTTATARLVYTFSL